MRFNKTENGITLVALVITIVVLIILATVTINFTFNQGGLVDRARQAGEFYANDTKYTDDSLTNVVHYINYVLTDTPAATGTATGSN